MTESNTIKFKVTLPRELHATAKMCADLKGCSVAELYAAAIQVAITHYARAAQRRKENKS